MEDEKILERIRNPTTSQVVWKLPEEGLALIDKSRLNGWLDDKNTE